MTDVECVVVMGVSGSGKTTIGRALAHALDWEYVEGDDLHPAANIRKMRSGVPLTDDDRMPWLARVAGRIDDERAARRPVVVACSALRRAYRDLLADGRPWLGFCHVEAPEAVIRARLGARRGHFMPSALLDSQLATLEPLAPDERGVTVDGTAPPDQIVRSVVEALGLG